MVIPLFLSLYYTFNLSFQFIQIQQPYAAYMEGFVIVAMFFIKYERYKVNHGPRIAY